MIYAAGTAALRGGFKPAFADADLSGMDWVLTTAAVLTVWGSVRVFGNERQRRIEEIEARAAAAEAALAAELVPPEAVPAH